MYKLDMAWLIVGEFFSEVVKHIYLFLFLGLIGSINLYIFAPILYDNYRYHKLVTLFPAKLFLPYLKKRIRKRMHEHFGFCYDMRSQVCQTFSRVLFPFLYSITLVMRIFLSHRRTLIYH